MTAGEKERVLYEAVSQDAVRKAGIRERDRLSEEEVREFSKKIVGRIAESEAFSKASVILIYRAFGKEADLSYLGRCVREKGLGKTLVYPYCMPGKERRMLALQPNDSQAFRPGMLHIEEPVLERSRIYAPESIDLVICPGTAFDEKLHRVGMGAGYYDRFLKQCSSAVIGMAAFECQKAGHICPNDWDTSMSIIWTEERVYT